MPEVFRQEDTLGRAMVNSAHGPTNRIRWDAPLVVAAGVVLLFAVVGVVSAGLFVAGKVSGSTVKSTPTVRPATSSSLAAQDIHRAQAQATAIVKQAQSAGHAIVASSNARAHRQANALIANARRQAATYRPPAVAAPAPAPTAVPNVGSSNFNSPTGSTAAGTSQVPTSSGAVSGTNTGSIASGSSAAVPNLSGVPASWKVVGYNASFGATAGGVGTISVINRSTRAFSGVATVKYRSGGSSSAAFSGLAPGQSLVLALHGSAYRGGGYQIILSGVH